jgi:hypothetical protein
MHLQCLHRCYLQTHSLAPSQSLRGEREYEEKLSLHQTSKIIFSKREEDWGRIIATFHQRLKNGQFSDIGYGLMSNHRLKMKQLSKQLNFNDAHLLIEWKKIKSFPAKTLVREETDIVV